MGTFQNAIESTFPDPMMTQSKAYYSNNIAVIETSLLPAGECSCDQFTFLVPLRHDLVIRMSNKAYHLKAGHFFPFNPSQSHWAGNTEIDHFQAYVIYVDHLMLRETAESMFTSSRLELINTSFYFNNAFNELICTFMREYSTGQPGYKLILESLSQKAAVTILRESRHNLSNIHMEQKEYRDENNIKKAIDFLTENYQDNITLDELAGETNYSPYHFLRLFKNHTGKTPFEYLLDIKIEKAKTLLRETDYTMTHICDLSGFSSCSYFSQVFRKKTGVTPTLYKKCI